MNIFFLDRNIKKCAQYHCDQHVVKMILESAQILCTICHLHGLKVPYKPTHQKHPCTIWTGSSLDNWLWLKELTCELNLEYKYRYQALKNHKSFEVVLKLQTPPLPKLGLLEHCQAMPDEYKVPGNPIKAYRNYYRKNKSKFATWRRRKAPAWFINYLPKNNPAKS